MTDFERRALLGDRQAQEECTKQKITLPCPLCGEQADIVVQKDAGLIICKRCKLYKPFTVVLDGVNKAREAWNRRPAPPIGQYGKCGAYTSEGPGLGYCSDGTGKTDDGYCDCFYPKGGEDGG